MVDFEVFRPYLERAVPRADGSKGGRPAFDHVLMFKVLLLQAMHTLSDERCEYLIEDRLSFVAAEVRSANRSSWHSFIRFSISPRAQ